jgi:hypothetical protein
MCHTIHIGSVLIQESPRMAQTLGLECESYSNNWSVVRALSSFALDRQIRAAGWNCFFMADEIKVNAFGSIQAASLQAALQRIFSKVRGQDFNCLEVTGIVGRHFLGIPYFTLSAHSRHIQSGFRLNQPEERRAVQAAADWAKGE